MKQFVIRFFHATVFALCSFFNKKMNHNPNKILFYSDLGFRDNVKALYDYIIEEKLNEKYTIVCATNDYKKFTSLQLQHVTFKNKFWGFWEYFSAGNVFYCFGRIPILPGKNQNVVQLWHGSPLKAASKKMLEKNSSNKLFFTHIIASSDFFVDVLSQWFSFPKEKIYVCGQPRNDKLFKQAHYNLGEYTKLLLWLPTFRNSSQMGHDSSQNQILPIFQENEFKELNDFLKQQNVKIIVKLHPVQNIDNYNLVDLENFILLSNDEFSKRKMDLYLLCSQADAMITDYSSIYFDYLLLNRPIAFTEDDIENYSNQRGFSVKNQDECKPGFRIKTKQEFYQFVTDVVTGKDDYTKEREKVNSWANTYTDNKSSERVLKLVGINK